MPALATGTTAPDFTLPALDGKRFSLHEALRKGPVVVVFFKITCPVCQFALPFIERLHHAYRGRGVAVVGISQNDTQSTSQFVKQYGITFPVVLDDPGKYEVSNAYGLTNVPTVFLIAPDGEITVSSVGWARKDIEEINAQLADVAQADRVPVFRRGEDIPDWKAG
ncbi:MAG: peroxiredoxin family protein [Terriglobales bacterium]